MNNESLNPYSAPITPDSAPVYPPSSSYFRDGKFLVIRDGAEMPRICLRTNEPVAEGGWRKQAPIIWTPSWVLICFLFGGPLVYAIVALCVQKRGKFTYSLSPRAHRRNIILRLIGSLILLFSVVLFILAFNETAQDKIGIYIISGLVSFFLCLIPLMLARPIKVGGFQNDWFKIKGCSPAFLDSIPNHPSGV